MFVGCASYKEKAYVHETESIRIKQPYKKTIFNMPNGKTYMKISSTQGIVPGGGALSIVKVPNQHVPEKHDFSQSGGLIGLDLTGEIPIKIDDNVYNYSIVEIDGVSYYKFRVGRKATLVPLD